MADQNQDLPLVVSEILIEMHEMRVDIKGLQTEMRQVQLAIVNLAGSMKTMMEENRSNTEMLIAAFREEGLYSRRLLEQHDARITRLENN